MIRGITKTRMDVGSIDHSQKLIRLGTPRDLEYCASSITRKDEGIVRNMMVTISNLFNKVWGGFKWIFSKVFFCYDYSGILGTSRLETVKELKKTAEGAKTKMEDLLKKHPSDREALANEWKKFFDELPKELQENLMETFFIGLAKGTKQLEDEGEILTFAKECFMLKKHCQDALQYVRELKMHSGYDPCDEMLDVSFDWIIEKFKKEIAKLETK